MIIKKFIIKFYQVIVDFLLNNSGCKFKWGDKKGVDRFKL